MSRPKSKSRLALDIETHGDVDVLHPKERPLVCVGLFDGAEVLIIPRPLLGPADYQGDDWAWPELLHELALWDLELHNGMFDIPTLTERLAVSGVDPESYGVQVGFDTQLAHYALRPAAEQGLKPLAKSFFGVDDWDQFHGFEGLARALSDGDRNWWWTHAWPVLEWMAEHIGVSSKKMDMKSLANYPDLMVQLYNGYDVLYTWMLRDFLTPFLEHHTDVAKASAHLHAFANMIMWDQLQGFPTDTAKASQMCTFLQEQVDSTRATLIEWAHSYLDPATLPGKQFNPGSPKQVQRLYASVGKKLAKTDKKVMTDLAEKGDKFAAKLLEHRSWAKELSTYAIKARDETNSIHGEPRLYPWYRLVATLTGRLSSGGVTNIQNWSKQEERPHEDRLRSVLVPTRLRDEPSVLVQVDYSQAELRVAAALSEDQWLIEQFADESVDIFTKMTMDIFPGLTDPQQIKLWRRPLKSCVPLDTKILTKRGWLSHDEVRVGDETPGLDSVGRTVWTKITKVHHPGVEKVYRVGHKSWSFRATADHDWLVGERAPLRKGYREPTKRETQDLLGDRCVYVAGQLEDEGSLSLTDDEVRIIAWVQSDGYLKISPFSGTTSQGGDGRRRGVLASIQQAKPEYVEEIKQLLKEVPHGVDTRPGVNYETAYNFRIKSQHARLLWAKADLMDGGIENFILRLPPHQREIWLEVFCKAEGHRDSRGTWLITQRRGEKADAINLCASLCGYRTSVVTHTKGANCVRIRLNKVQHVGMQTAKIEELGQEEVWCVTTELGSWTARQGDTITVTGNCVYGLAFGRQAKAIALELGIPVAQAQSIINQFLGMATGYAELRRWTTQAAATGKPIVTRYGRHFQHELVTSRNKAAVQRSALSFLPQSSASDTTLTAYMRLRPIAKERGWIFRAAVHDALTYDVPLNQATECIDIVSHHMIQAGNDMFPEVKWAVDGKYATDWSRTG